LGPICDPPFHRSAPFFWGLMAYQPWYLFGLSTPLLSLQASPTWVLFFERFFRNTPRSPLNLLKVDCLPLFLGVFPQRLAHVGERCYRASRRSWSCLGVWPMLSIRSTFAPIFNYLPPSSPAPFFCLVRPLSAQPPPPFFSTQAAQPIV